MTPSLKAKRDELAQQDHNKYFDDYADVPCFIRGFNACYAELWPMVMEMKEALDDIASWKEGPVISGRFDEPGSAGIARAILEKYKEVLGWKQSSNQ